jgi:hypothetical protein
MSYKILVEVKRLAEVKMPLFMTLSELRIWEIVQDKKKSI